MASWTQFIATWERGHQTERGVAKRNWLGLDFLEPRTPRPGDCVDGLEPSVGEVDVWIAAPGAFGPQRAPASVEANKSANGSMVESRSRKSKAFCRHGDEGERNTSSLDEGGLLMEARQQDSEKLEW